MKTLLFIGGALTHGLGDREALGWAGRVNRQLIRERRAIQHFNLGIPWDVLPEISRRAEREAKPRLAGVEDALIFLEPGHNDFAIRPDGRRRTDATTFDAHLDTLLEMLNGLAQVILIGPPPVHEEMMPVACPHTGEELRFTNKALGVVSQRMSDICAPRGIPFIDLLEVMEKAPAYFMALEEGDGIHPTTAGHKLIADHVHAEIVYLMEHEDA